MSVDVETLRQQLRERGYLTHGIDRWFALDPWSSRTFWSELIAVASKAATLVALFGALAMMAIMIIRNHPLTPLETLILALSYGGLWFLLGAGLVLALALGLRSRPQLALDTPRALLGISLASSGALTALLALWWHGFRAAPRSLELVVGAVAIALFFVITTIATSAALLSFSIYELRRVPAIHQRPRGRAMAIAAAILLLILFIPAHEARHAEEPQQVIVTPTAARVALIAVDGLTHDIAISRPALVAQFAAIAPLQTITARSTAERWASVGTGVSATAHGVRSIEGAQLFGGEHILQEISQFDPPLRHIVARRQPLPPSARKREYVWEIFSRRGVTTVATNWWTSASQEQIFNAAGSNALRVDTIAATRLLEEVDRAKPRLATVYLPAMDIILNRTTSDDSTRLAMSVRVLDHLTGLVNALRQRGYEVLLTGLPGDRQAGEGVLASTIPARPPATAFDIAPTLCDMFGFPATEEMPGHSIVGTHSAPRIATYGNRSTDSVPHKVNQEYYENLRSLGYIQ